MEKEIKCKSLTAIFQSDIIILDSPHNIEFETEGINPIHIKVEQYGIRKITLTSADDISVFVLNAVFARVERLLYVYYLITNAIFGI